MNRRITRADFAAATYPLPPALSGGGGGGGNLPVLTGETVTSDGLGQVQNAFLLTLSDNTSYDILARFLGTDTADGSEFRVDVTGGWFRKGGSFATNNWGPTPLFQNGTIVGASATIFGMGNLLAFQVTGPVSHTLNWRVDLQAASRANV